MNVGQSLEYSPNNLYFDLILFESRINKISESSTSYKLHDDIQDFERKVGSIVLMRYLRWVIMMLEGYFPMGIIYGTWFAILLELNFTVSLESDFIIFLKHDIILWMLLIIAFIMFFNFGMVLKKYSSTSWLPPIFIHMLQFLLFLRFCDRHVMNEFVHRTYVL